MQTIAIDASRAFLKCRTGIEEYSYQVIKHLRHELQGSRVVLYVRKKWVINNLRLTTQIPEVDFELPENWEVKGLWAPRFWTQWRLSLEMLFTRPDVLLVLAHTVPVIHPARTVVVVHGLEYEFCPEAYSWWERLYMRWSIRYSARVASQVICVSENTKRDLIRLYRIEGEEIQVVYEGYEENFQFPISNFQSEAKLVDSKSYFLFIGRLEERKNVARMIEAFDIFKQKTHFPHKLVLAGRPGYGYEKIQFSISRSQFSNEIIEVGYVSEEEKWRLLAGAEVFVFPTLYEGFGIPILEAQSVGVPVIASNNSSIPEVAGDAAFLVDPLDTDALVDAMEKLATDENVKKEIVKRGLENVKRFSWGKCAYEIMEIVNAGV